MNNLNRRVIYYSAFFWLSTFLATNAASQGFLDMPDTTEVPEYERDSMLLDLDIPSVRERDPDPEAGPRLSVKEFRLQGLLEYPELGITREELIKRVESIRFDLMQEGELTKSGYTLDELGEVSDLMAVIEKKTEGQHVGPLEVQKLVFLIREQRRKRGVTLGMIETVADTITRFYRERGFILAKAYIPQQKVRDGIVTLTLLLGELGEVVVENDKRVSKKLVRSVFRHDIDKPVTSWKVEESLFLINDIPGVIAQGFFSPGSQVGDTKLTVNILDEKWYTGTFRLDNHGSEATSENRGYLDINIHNPFGTGDNLYFALLNSYDPDTSTYGAIRYSSFIFNPRARAELGFSQNDFVSRNTLNADEFITGESDVVDASLSYHLKRSRVKNYSVELSYQDIATTLDANGFISEQDVKKTTIGFNFDVLNEKRRQLYAGSFYLSSADTTSFTVFGPESRTESFFHFDLTMLSFFDFPFTDKETRFVVNSSGQYAGKRLSNLTQISLTGPTRTRAFGINGFQADDAIYVGVDWIFNLPRFNDAQLFGLAINRIFQPFIYIDATYGESTPFVEDQGKDRGKMANVGMGLKFNFKHFSGTLLLSEPVKDEVLEIKDQTPTSSVYFELQYEF